MMAGHDRHLGPLRCLPSFPPHTYQLLEVQLGCNAHEQVQVQLVVVRDERPRGSAACENRMAVAGESD